MKRAVEMRTGDRVVLRGSQIPHVSGHRNAREMLNMTQRKRLVEALEADPSARAGGGAPGRSPVFSPGRYELRELPHAMSRRYIQAAELKTSSWRNEVTLPSSFAYTARRVKR